MKISFNWLRQYLPVGQPAAEVANRLTGCGLEVEGMETWQPVKGGLKGLVIGEVLTCIKHPNADKLSLTTVDTGGTVLSIVCGAPNVAAGQKVIVAMPGTMIHPVKGEPFEIKKSKIRGEASEGMICAEDEIGLGESHAGIIVLPPEVKTGMPAAEYYRVEEDTVFEIGLTPNRADAASHIGVARDLRAALLHAGDGSAPQIVMPSVEKFKTQDHGFVIDVEVQSDACLRYSGVTLQGVTVKESPAWLKDRLRSIGVAPINNVVDVTNFVLHECGQPLHAFDASRIAGKKVVVRTAREGEKFITLDSVERTLAASDLMICSATESMCIAGVFGGLNSGITSDTHNVFLESACFSPASVRKTSKRHGLKTDASFRFERGTDPGITIYALQRAALLICEIAGGHVASDVVDILPQPLQPARVELQYSVLDGLAGEVIDRQRVKSILASLDFVAEKESAEGLILLVPSHKTDVHRPADVVEEILRIHGFNNIGLPKALRSSVPQPGLAAALPARDAVAEFLSGNGFLELMTNSLVPSRYSDTAGLPPPVRILNALSQDLDAMRQLMLFGAMEALAYNRNRKHPHARFFEFGKTYSLHGSGYAESNRLALVISGKKSEASWNADKSEPDFFYLKAFIQNVLQRAGLNAGDLEAKPAENIPWMSEGLAIYKQTRFIVAFGKVKSSLLKIFDMPGPVWHADFDWDAVEKSRPPQPHQFEDISRFPPVRRDLSMVLGRDVTFEKLEKLAYTTERDLLQEVQLFDVYEGDKIEAGKKSYAMSFILQDNRQTLTDKQIDKTMNRLMEAFEKQLGAVIRKQ